MIGVVFVLDMCVLVFHLIAIGSVLGAVDTVDCWLGCAV